MNMMEGVGHEATGAEVMGTMTAVIVLLAQAAPPIVEQPAPPVRYSNGDPTGGTLRSNPQVGPDTMICRTERASGSFVRKRTVCRTKREWDRAAIEGRDAARLYEERVGPPGV